ncbi:hypothetical protein J5N97_017681 [Dioscorea zingiberensis]|uniref:Uncharacterized protein n=1 Tax=Dioscorea zingiberensis TaxID=325984 RepID=A0A9D5CLT4_9LILI|nr:hypothetical protein J5N97_017681 [Dioscorea zingiberensis]
MGCVHSRVENEEAVRRCKERRRLMKQLLSCRAELAAAHMAYLQSLRNTGATLRQFTEAESVAPVSSPLHLVLPPSPPPPPPPPPPPLPPSPPPPPFSPDERKGGATLEKSSIVEGSTDDEDDDDELDLDSCMPPMPPLHGSAWDFLDPFGPPSSSTSSSPVPVRKDEGAVLQAGEEENWAETNTEFAEDEEEVDAVRNVVLNPMKEKSLMRDLADDTSSVVSGFTRDTDMAVVVWRSKKTLLGIVKELDDYFLKAAAGGKDLAVLLDSNRRRLDWDFEEQKGKRSKSAKVFNALSWSWSSKSLQSCRDGHFGGTGDTCRPGNHCTTLEKIYAEEQRLYKEVKEEEIAKYEHRKKTLLLQKLEAGDHDCSKAEKARTNIEYLQSRILSLQESINGTCLSISKLRDEELHPQLLEFSTGLMHMWRTMYECHQVQNHISQQVNLLDNQPGTEPTTDTHRQATVQLENEVMSWYSSFCNLLRCQREYVHVLNRWVRLTDCLPDIDDQTGSAIGIRVLGEEWQLALDRLPDKVTADAIKSFVSVIHSIVEQQIEEQNLQKRSGRLESRLEKELDSLAEFDRHNENIMAGNQDQMAEARQHLLSSKHVKLDGLKKRVEDEKAKYFNSVRLSRAMTLNKLHTSLPTVFQALMGFSSVCVQAFEGIQRPQSEANEGVSPLHS